MDNIKAANKLIKEGLALLPDTAKEEWKAKASKEGIFIDEAINNACGAINGNEEKEAMLAAYAVQEANRMASTLWRLQVITDEFEKEYRKLISMDDIVKPYNEFLEARNKRADEVAKLGNAIQEERKDLEIFMGIINGIPAVESEKRYSEYQQRQQAAIAGGR